MQHPAIGWSRGQAGIGTADSAIAAIEPRLAEAGIVRGPDGSWTIVGRPTASSAAVPATSALQSRVSEITPASISTGSSRTVPGAPSVPVPPGGTPPVPPGSPPVLPRAGPDPGSDAHASTRKCATGRSGPGDDRHRGAQCHGGRRHRHRSGSGASNRRIRPRSRRPRGLPGAPPPIAPSPPRPAPQVVPSPASGRRSRASDRRHARGGAAHQPLLRHLADGTSRSAAPFPTEDQAAAQQAAGTPSTGYRTDAWPRHRSSPTRRSRPPRSRHAGHRRTRCQRRRRDRHRPGPDRSQHPGHRPGRRHSRAARRGTDPSAAACTGSRSSTRTRTGPGTRAHSGATAADHTARCRTSQHADRLAGRESGIDHAVTTRAAPTFPAGFPFSERQAADLSTLGETIAQRVKSRQTGRVSPATTGLPGGLARSPDSATVSGPWWRRVRVSPHG